MILTPFLRYFDNSSGSSDLFLLDSRQKCYTFEPGVRVYATFEPWICPQRCRCSVGLAKTHLSVENRFRPHSWTLPRTQWVQIISLVVFSFLARCVLTEYFFSCKAGYSHCLSNFALKWWLILHASFWKNCIVLHRIGQIEVKLHNNTGYSFLECFIL